MSKTFYVTTPIYYVNDVPHIGHAYTTVLADVLARYHKLLGDEVFFLTGTDEHGQKVQQAAEKSGLTPQTHCDLYSKRFRDAWDGLNIGYDHFIRTTDPAHIAFVREQLTRLKEKNLPSGEPLIYEKEYAGWYSTSEERFFSENELIDGKDPVSGRAVEWITEKNYFFRMSSFQQQLIDHIEKNPDFILPDFRRNEVLGFLRQPLKDLCISRPKSRLSWGISLPFDEDYVAYVWVDALLNYASAVNGQAWSDGKPRWPADFHLIGKDILTTHAVYWTTILMALDMPLPKHILAHGWWMIDNARMSKTTGNVVSPLAMKDKYGVDAFRYFLIREMVVGSDASYTEDVFVSRYNADLANDVGNALSRVMKLAESLDFKIFHPNANDGWKEEKEWEAHDLENRVTSALNRVSLCVEKLFFSHLMDGISLLFRGVNQYFEKTAPWKLAKAGEAKKRELNTVLWNSAEALRIGFTLLYPVMPEKMTEALSVLGFQIQNSPLRWRNWSDEEPTLSIRVGKEITDFPFVVKSIQPLFPRIVVEAAPVLVAAEVKDPFSSVELRAVKILSAEDHPNAEALYVLQVDAGSESRTVCAGLRKHLTKEEVLGKTAVLVANLKPVSLRGVMSQGMLLAADGVDGKLSLVIPESAQPGDSITAEGLQSEPKAQITIKDFERCSLKVVNGVVCYGARPLKSSKGPVIAHAPDGAVVR